MSSCGMMLTGRPLSQVKQSNNRGKCVYTSQKLQGISQELIYINGE